MHLQLSHGAWSGCHAWCLRLTLSAWSWGLGGLGCGVPPAQTHSAVLGPVCGAMPGASVLHCQGSPGAWAGRCTGSLWHALKVRGPGVWGPGAPARRHGRLLWPVVTADVWEPATRECVIHCMCPCELCLVSVSLCGFRLVSEASLGIGVAAFLASTAPPYNMAWSPGQSHTWPGSSCGSSRDFLSRRA